jgi:hypothetical protein
VILGMLTKHKPELCRGTKRAFEEQSVLHGTSIIGEKPHANTREGAKVHKALASTIDRHRCANLDCDRGLCVEFSNGANPLKAIDCRSRIRHRDHHGVTAKECGPCDAFERLSLTIAR